MRFTSWRVAALLIAVACASPSEAIVSGAGYLTFDETLGGCLNSLNNVNCNIYQAKEYVYIGGGPVKAGLSDGDYFFAVLIPGYQTGGYVDGAEGNLSSDGWENRVFTVAAHGIVAYAGTHAMGISNDGKPIIGLAPFADTTNPGGVYILAICLTPVAGDSGLVWPTPAGCKYDAFKVGAGVPPPPALVGGKYYDANANGAWDPGEVGIAGWPIRISDGTSEVVYTGADGTFDVDVVAGTYVVTEIPAAVPWRQTGNLVSQIAVNGGAAASLENLVYSLTAVDGSEVAGLYFGNVCLGAGGGLTLGFWSNKNGAALFTSADLAMLVALQLRDATGAAFDPASYAAFRTWLLNASATNMAYMLSAQLATMELNVAHGFVSAGALVYAPGVTGANANGFIAIGDLMSAADAALAADGYTVASSPDRVAQALLKTALDNANNNLTFVQPTPATCPAPVFP